MGWLQRMFNTAKDETAAVNPPEQSGGVGTASKPIPAERIGLHGEFDQSGLAKRVALAFDQDPTFKDISTVWVAQTGSTVVLKGHVPSPEILQKLTTIAGNVKGATRVETDEVTIS